MIENIATVVFFTIWSGIAISFTHSIVTHKKQPEVVSDSTYYELDSLDYGTSNY